MTSISHQHVLTWCQYTPNIKQKNTKIFNKDNEASQLSFFFEMLSFLIFLMSSCQTLSLIPPVLHHILWFQRGGGVEALPTDASSDRVPLNQKSVSSF